MRKTPLFGNPEALRESDKQIQLQSQSANVRMLVNNIKSFLKANNPAIVAYIGEYGTGKSVIINNAII